jgi:hypothetical protein
MYILSSHDKGVGKNMIISLDLEGAVQNYYKKIIQIVNLSWGLLWMLRLRDIKKSIWVDETELRWIHN